MTVPSEWGRARRLADVRREPTTPEALLGPAWRGPGRGGAAPLPRRGPQHLRDAEPRPALGRLPVSRVCLHSFSLAQLVARAGGARFSDDYAERFQRGLAYSAHAFRPSGSGVPWADSDADRRAVTAALAPGGRIARSLQHPRGERPSLRPGSRPRYRRGTPLVPPRQGTRRVPAAVAQPSATAAARCFGGHARLVHGIEQSQLVRDLFNNESLPTHRSSFAAMSIRDATRSTARPWLAISSPERPQYPTRQRWDPWSQPRLAVRQRVTDRERR
jgi:hypothetical protein